MLNLEEMKMVKSLISNMDADNISDMSFALKQQRTFLGRSVIRDLVIGDKVEFDGRNGRVSGTVSKVAIKNVSVDTSEGRWRVPASMLTKVA
jgi:hypothetical protein|tara:strand:+ start:70 stop:345 length:276 start_codon:yes stop_codon:yes gene_type:complete